MISYFIKSTSCLALLLLFYHLILEREKMHQFNRFYLLGSVVFSFLAPLFIIYTKIIPNNFEIIQQTTNQVFSIEITEINNAINYWNYFFCISIFISSILLIRFVKNIFTIHQKAKGNSNVKHQKAILVLVEDVINPHTFLNYIFINKEAYHSRKIEKELFTHELTHALQKHTLDVLFIEFLKIIFWFNPIFYFLKRTIQLNHEFLADTKVIANHNNISEYQYLLLDKTARNHEYYLASNLNYLLTKKRLLMMTKQSSRTSILIKKLAIIPVLAGFTFLFAERIEAKETTIKTDISKNNSLLYQKKKLGSLSPAKTGFHKVNNNKSYYIKNKKGTTYYNKHGQEISKKGNHLVVNCKQVNIPPPPPPKANFPKVNINDISNVPPPPCSDSKKGSTLNTPLPPPPPMNASKLVSEHPNAIYYFNNKKVTYRKISKLVKKKKNLSVYTQVTNNKKVIKFTTKNSIEEKLPKYYLDEKLITKEAADKIAPENIKSVNVKKNKKTGGSIYIISHKK